MPKVSGLPIVEKGGKLYVDLRGKKWGGLGVLALGMDAGMPPAHVQAAAVEVYAQRRQAAPQLSFETGAPRTWGALVRAFFALPEDGGESFATEDTRSHYAQHARTVTKDLGLSLGLEVFAPPGGNLFLDRQLAKWTADGLAWKTRKHRINVIRRLLIWAHRRGYITTLPQWPRHVLQEGERPNRDEWVTEEQFWLILAPQNIAPEFARRMAKGDQKARLNLLDRQAFYAWAFYTGQHVKDCRIVREGIDLELRKGVYAIKNTKNARLMAKREAGTEKLPAPLREALQELVDCRGGHFAKGERIFKPSCKGDGKVSQILKSAVKRANVDLPSPLPMISHQDLRRSFCSALANAGVPESRAVYLMGHSSSDMVRKVYRQYLNDVGDAAAAFASSRPRQQGPAIVVDFVRPKLQLA